jgi:hypothetical protein
MTVTGAEGWELARPAPFSVESAFPMGGGCGPSGASLRDDKKEGVCAVLE